MQGDYSPGKPGKPGKVRENGKKWSGKSQGKWKKSGESQGK